MEKDERQWFMGVDWASPGAPGLVDGRGGGKLGERSFAHSGEGLAEMADWAVGLTGSPAAAIDVAIEAPHGPVVEADGRGLSTVVDQPQAGRPLPRSLLRRPGPRTTAATPRCSRRSAHRSRRAFRRPERRRSGDDRAARVVQDVRGAARRAEAPGQPPPRPAVALLAGGHRTGPWRHRRRLVHRADHPRPPRPSRPRLRSDTVARLLKRHRIRRLDAAGVLEALKSAPLEVAPGTVQAASAHVKLLAKRLALAASHISREVRKGPRPPASRPSPRRTRNRGSPRRIMT